MKTKSLKIVSELSKINPNQLLLVCKSVGNPDHGQYAPLSETEYFIIDCYEQAAAASRAYIEIWDLGGGNWPDGNIYDKAGNAVAGVSYNGRVWKKQLGTKSINAEIKLDAETVKKFYQYYTLKYREMLDAYAKSQGIEFNF